MTKIEGDLLASVYKTIKTVEGRSIHMSNAFTTICLKMAAVVLLDFDFARRILEEHKNE